MLFGGNGIGRFGGNLVVPVAFVVAVTVEVSVDAVVVVSSVDAPSSVVFVVVTVVVSADAVLVVSSVCALTEIAPNAKRAMRAMLIFLFI